MASSRQFEILLPFLGLVAVGVFHNLKRKKVRQCDFDDSIQDKSGSPGDAISKFQLNIINKDLQEHTCTNKDCITRLPDDILCHIFSYLDMNDTLQTSVLSRQWRKLYCTLLSNPKFEFHKMVEVVTPKKHKNCHRDYKQRFVTAVDKQRFVTAVDTFLCVRSSFPMESFTLQFCLMREFPGHLRRWLNCIVRSGVRKLDIDFRSNDKLPKIPDSNSELVVFPFKVLLSACMLEYVKLSFCILEPNFQGSSNSLKELSFNSIPLVNGELESILSSCPQLKLLDVRHCKLPRKLIVNALELRTLTIYFCEQVNEIGFSAPNLDVFEYYGNGNRALSFLPSYVPNMRRFCVDFMGHNGPPHGFGGFVQGAHCLHVLFIQALPYQVQYIQTEMPKLLNVHTLSLHVINGSLDLRDIISMIAVCPNIFRFELSTPLCSWSYTERDAEVLPTCVNLKSISFDGFKFDPAQKRFASQLLRCAPALEIMRIYTAYCKHDFGKQVEQALPLERRVFSNILIVNTQEELQRQALSSSTVVKLYGLFA